MERLPITVISHTNYNHSKIVSETNNKDFTINRKTIPTSNGKNSILKNNKRSLHARIYCSLYVHTYASARLENARNNPVLHGALIFISNWIKIEISTYIIVSPLLHWVYSSIELRAVQGVW